MKRVGGLIARAFALALLLLSLAGNVASADPGHRGHGAHAAPATQTLTLPDDPGYTGGGWGLDLLPDDPGYNP